MDDFVSDILACVQDELSFELRARVAGMLAKNRTREMEKAFPEHRYGNPNAGNELNNKGYHRLGRVLDRDSVKHAINFLSNRKVYAAHVPVYSDGVARNIKDTKKISDYGSYKLSDVIETPGILDLALRDDILDIVTDYIGAPPLIYSMHAWWTYADRPTPGLTHSIHRDQDDYRFVSLFLLLTDVPTLEDGPTVYYAGTHQAKTLAPISIAHPSPSVRALAHQIGTLNNFFPPLSGNAYHISDLLRRLFKSEEVIFTGMAGTAVLADTFGFHSGTQPVENDRLVVWLRYGLYRNLAYQIDKTSPVPINTEIYQRLTPIQREMTKLLISNK
ncbi:hypothetical protein [Azospirillum griseum]|uniref:Phytanoyl-CoA dioxygenase n=1 Tax=Azospirillum griseum TaxID=2496639 RepID=A0A431V9K5_9PROT|nr:hypothetical protein [Azospirillum griseum]RTR11993.1 hypothetical protein EJ903_25805 [Azospirillum griseum]